MGACSAAPLCGGDFPCKWDIGAKKNGPRRVGPFQEDNDERVYAPRRRRKAAAPMASIASVHGSGVTPLTL